MGLFEAVLGSATLAATAGLIARSFGKRAADTAFDALATAMKRVPWRRVAAKVAGPEIKASNDKFCLVICSLLNDEQYTHSRIISSVFTKMKNITVILEDEPIKFSFSGRLTDIKERTKKLATAVLARRNGDIAIFGEVINEHTSVRLMFCTKAGGFYNSEEPFVLENAQLPAQFKKTLALLTVSEINSLLSSIIRARDHGLPYDYKPSIKKLTSIEQDNMLEKDTYHYERLCITKMKVLFAQYVDVGGIEKLRVAIEAGRLAVSVFESSPYERNDAVIELSRCLYLYSGAQKDKTILDEVEALSQETIDFYYNEPEEFDFAPFHDHRILAMKYLLGRKLSPESRAKKSALHDSTSKYVEGHLRLGCYTSTRKCRRNNSGSA
jgi:hypothetical protein